MKKSLLLATAAAVALLSGCAAPLPGQAPPTPAQVAGQVCPIVQPIVAQIGLIAPDPKIDLASGILTTVCAVGASVTTGNLQAIVGQVFPAIATALTNSALVPPDKRTAIQQDLVLAQLIVAGALALNPPVTSIGTVVPVPAASAAAAK